MRVIAQSVEQAEALKHVVLGRGIDEGGKETGISLNCIAVFTCAVQEIQEVSEIVKHNPNMHEIKTWHVLVYSFIIMLILIQFIFFIQS